MLKLLFKVDSNLKTKTVLTILVLISLRLTGQNFEIDVTLGVPRSKLIFHQNFKIDGSNLYNDQGSLYCLGITSIGKKTLDFVQR